MSLSVEVLLHALANFVRVKHPACCHACLEGPRPSDAEAKVVAGGQVGWVMEEGVVSFEKVQDWGPLQCQRHICEIQGLFPAPKLTNLIRKSILSC